MEEFEKSVNAFLEFRQYKILKDNGRISHKQAQMLNMRYLTRLSLLNQILIRR